MTNDQGITIFIPNKGGEKNADGTRKDCPAVGLWHARLARRHYLRAMSAVGLSQRGVGVSRQRYCSIALPGGTKANWRDETSPAQCAVCRSFGPERHRREGRAAVAAPAPWQRGWPAGAGGRVGVPPALRHGRPALPAQGQRPAARGRGDRRGQRRAAQAAAAAQRQIALAGGLRRRHWRADPGVLSRPWRLHPPSAASGGTALRVRQHRLVWRAAADRPSRFHRAAGGICQPAPGRAGLSAHRGLTTARAGACSTCGTGAGA